MTFGWLSDSQVGYLQYGLERRRNDFEFALENTVDVILSKGIKLICHTGDLLNSNRPGPEAIACLRRVHRKLVASGARMIVVSGNHDKTDPPWPTLLEPAGNNLGMTVQDHQIITVDGIGFYCLPYMPADQFRAIQWPEARVLLCHQMVQQFIGIVNPNALALSELPANKYAAILMGDIHILDIRQHPDHPLCLVGYPGSTELNSESEPSEKFWIELELDPDTGWIHHWQKHPILTRLVLRWKVENLESIPKYLDAVDNLWHLHKHKTGDDREPILFVEYPSDLPGVMERFQARFDPSRWVLRWKPVLRPLGPTGVPLLPSENELTTKDILSAQLAMRQDLLPVASQLINPELDPNAALDEYINERLRAIEAPAGPAGG